jgi:glycosyltransferase involved in cell wall biosynthesis
MAIYTGNRPVNTYSSPSIGVIIPTRNRPEYLRAAIHSVLAQTHLVQEILVSDNNSSKPVKEFVQGLDIPCLRYHYHDHLLPMEEHWHWALQQMKSDYVCFLSDDDLWRPNHLGCFMRAYQLYPDYPLYGAAAFPCAGEVAPCQGDIVAPVWDCDLLTQRPSRIPRDAACAVFMAGTPFASCAIMIDRRLLSKMKLTLSGCIVSFDAWLWLQFALYGDTVYVPEITSLYRTHGGQAVSTINRRMWRVDHHRFGKLVSHKIEFCRVDVISGIEWLKHNTDERGFRFYLENLVRVQSPTVISSLCRQSSLLRKELTAGNLCRLKFTKPLIRRILRWVA